MGNLPVLLAKDLRRAWRNPWPWIINLIVPLAMTALLGMVFGGSSSNRALGRIRFAVVDEDQSILSRFLRGAVNQNQAGDHLEPVFLDRTNALKLVAENKISAVLILETNTLRNYLTGRAPVRLQLIKNPAESIHPAVIEELTGALVTAMNALARNFQSEFPAWQAVLEGKEDYHQVTRLVDRAGDKLKAVKQFVDPPLVGYTKETNATDTTIATLGGGGKPAATTTNDNLHSTFAFLLLGMSGMFLLFLGQNAMTDLHRELRKRTFERYQTIHSQVWPFIVSKILFSVVMLLICSAVLLGGGGLVFQLHWPHPAGLLALAGAYSLCVAALFAVLVALMPDERRAGVLNNVAGMGLGLAGGCAFPARQLPAFVREHLTPLMPSNWFVEAARNLQFDAANAACGMACLKLILCAAALTAVAAVLMRRKFQTGARP